MPDMKEELPAKRSLGTVAVVDGPMPAIDKVTYSQRPKGAAPASPLKPAVVGSDMIDAELRVNMDGKKELVLVLEPTGLVGAAYVGRGHGADSADSPQLLIDYEPKAKP